MIATHAERRAAARTINDDPTETDQSGATETDLNVILQRYAQSGTLQGQAGQPMYYDWTEYPEDFRGYLEMARNADTLKQQLPTQLAHMTEEQLLALTPADILKILTPADTTKPTEEPK